MKEMLEMIVGDYSGDGHNMYQTFNLEIEHDNSKEIEQRLLNNEQILNDKYEIDLSNWFKEYEENTLSDEEIQKLKNLNIKIDEETNELRFYDAEEFIDIWIQLMHLVDPEIKINRINYKTYMSNCTGYGLFIV